MATQPKTQPPGRQTDTVVILVLFFIATLVSVVFIVDAMLQSYVDDLLAASERLMDHEARLVRVEDSLEGKKLEVDSEIQPQPAATDSVDPCKLPLLTDATRPEFKETLSADMPILRVQSMMLEELLARCAPSLTHEDVQSVRATIEKMRTLAGEAAVSGESEPAGTTP